MYIEFCRCKRRILTSGQQRDNKPCGICQEEQRQTPSITRINEQAKEIKNR